MCQLVQLLKRSLIFHEISRVVVVRQQRAEQSVQWVITKCVENWLRNQRKTRNTCLMKWNESGFRPPLCTYRLNWARRTSEAEHATSRSRRLPTILTFTRGWGRNNFVSFKPPRPGTEPRTLAWKAAVLTTTLGPPSNMWLVLRPFSI